MAKKYKLTQDGPEVQALLNKIDGLKANQTPGQGVEPIQMENLSLGGVLYAFLTSAVSNLLYYYTKSETYSKSEVDALVAAIKQFTIQSVDALPQPPSAATMNILYLVPAEEPKVANEKDEFITVIKDGSYAWEQIGSTAIDLSGYVTTEALNTALANYVTSDALTTALAGLNDVKYTAQSLTDSQKAQARTNIGAGDAETVQELDEKVNGSTVTGWTALEAESTTTGKCLRATLTSSTTSINNNTSFRVAIFRIVNGNTVRITAKKPAGSTFGSQATDFFAYSSSSQATSFDRVASGEAKESMSSGNITNFEFICSSDGYLAVVGDSSVQPKCELLSIQRTSGLDERVEDLEEGAEMAENKAQTLDGNENNTTKYPSTKAVADALALKYTKPASGIPASDLATGVIPDVSGKEDSSNKSQSVETDKTSTTKYPSTKAVADAIEAGKQIFWAEYGVNTLSEITTAYNSGKAVLCLRHGALHVISKLETTYCYFTCVNRTASQFLLLNGQTSWSAGTVSLQSTGNLSQSVPTDLESTTKYPSVKAVADALATKYEKPQTGIPASDLANGVIPSVPVQDVTLGGTSVVSNGVAVLPSYPEDQFHIAYYQSTTWAQVNEWIEDDNKPIILFAPGAYRNVTAIYCGTDDYGNHLFFSFDDYDNISKFVLGEQGWSTDVIEIQHLIDSRHKLDYSLLSNTPTIPTVESMTAQEVATAVATAWNNVIGS